MLIDPTSTRMYVEAAEAGATVRRQNELNTSAAKRIGGVLRNLRPAFITTVARGSSDHAACYAKYLLETRTGLVTASLAPSVASVYRTPLHLKGSLCLVISQSGASPDLLATAQTAREAGAFVVALVNVPGSPLSRIADEVLELRAGTEHSVAATKSFIGSLSALLQLLGHWQEDRVLLEALARTPDMLHAAWTCDWSPAIPAVCDSGSLYVLGRGPGLGVALEAALKFKEVCGLHAEAFSTAEVMHGPVTMVKGEFPVMVLAQGDETLDGIRQLVDRLAARGTRLITSGIGHDGAINLPTPSGHPLIEPMLRIQSFYRMVNEVAVRLGRNPDHPPHLHKVTATV